MGASWEKSFAGDPQQVADRLTAWARAASVLARSLAAEQYRAPRFRETLDTFIRSATRLASRTQATAHDPAAWARVFAGLPAGASSAGPDPETVTSAQPTAGIPQPDAAAPPGEQHTPAVAVAQPPQGTQPLSRAHPLGREPARRNGCCTPTARR